MKEPETEKEINDAISDYTNLLNHSGWKRVVAQLNENIEFLRNRLESDEEDEKLSDVQRVRDKLGLLKEMRNTPQNMIKKLESPEIEASNPDPFDTVEDVKKRKGGAVDKPVKE
jgi:hypothetical protein